MVIKVPQNTLGYLVLLLSEEVQLQSAPTENVVWLQERSVRVQHINCHLVLKLHAHSPEDPAHVRAEY